MVRPMPSPSDLALAELLCARLCHDLAGPVGGVGTGAELLAEEEGGRPFASGEALALLADSAAVAGAKLRFLRLALGHGHAAVAAGQMREMASAYYSAGMAGRIRFSWRDGQDGPWDQALAKLAANLLLVAEDCLPRGGELALEARGGHLLSVTAQGPAVAAGQALDGMAAEGVAALGARGAQGYYTAALAFNAGYRVISSIEAGRLRLVAEGMGPGAGP